MGADLFLGRMPSYMGGGIYKSSDNGASWTQVNATMGAYKFFIDGTDLYAYSQDVYNIQSIWRSTDGGVTWIDIIAGNFPSPIYASFCTYDSKLFMGRRNNGLYCSTDYGANWFGINLGFDSNNLPTLELPVVIGSSHMIAGTTAQSVWRRNLSTINPPAQPVEITGLLYPCINSTQTYSVDETAGVTYTWQIPSDWILTEGQSTNSITVNVGNSTGFITVMPSNEFGNGLLKTISVTPMESPPAQPSAISGSATPCAGSTQLYNVTNIAGLIYNWTLPSDWTLLSGQTLNSISVTVGNETGNIAVTPSNACIAGIPQTLAVTTNQIPVQPGAISGLIAPVTGTMEIYSVTNTLGVSYQWTLPPNWIIISGNASSLIVVTVGSASGHITCTPSNDCGSGIAQTLAVASHLSGINDIPDNNNIKVYPNPASSILNIEIENVEKNAVIQIVNAQGNTKFQSSCESLNSKWFKSLDISNYAGGLYFIQIINNGISHTQKLVIN